MLTITLSQTWECFTKGIDSKLEAREGATSGPRYCGFPDCLIANLDLMTTVLDAVRGVADAKECQVRCRLHPQCAYFTYAEDPYKICYLKDQTALPGTTHKPGLISGPRTCICKGDRWILALLEGHGKKISFSSPHLVNEFREIRGHTYEFFGLFKPTDKQVGGVWLSSMVSTETCKAVYLVSAFYHFHPPTLHYVQ